MKIIVYRDKRGQWRWQMLARNHRIVADSGESYKRRADAMRMVRRIVDGGMTVEVKE